MADKHGAFRKQALGAFVRSVRDRVTPQQAGIAGGQRRRTPACVAKKWPSFVISALPGTPGLNRGAMCLCRPLFGRGLLPYCK